MGSNSLPFVRYGYRDHGHVRWFFGDELSPLPGTEPTAEPISERYQFHWWGPNGDREGGGVVAIFDGRPRIDGRPAPMVFYARHLDSRFVGVYYATVRPLCEGPLFARRGWYRRFPALCRTLEAQRREIRSRGRSGPPAVSLLRLVDEPSAARRGN